ncbi:porin [Tardiphaga sp.]|uniref:porin n=1 Tax=Tardiphaga sp. TaxID=1926292 RepID=UPI0037D99175
MKTTILSTAASLAVMSGALAADLPVKAKAVEYVKVCSLYGAGFYYIPGTDTCIKIGGAIRLDTTFNGNTYDAPFWQGGAGGNDLWTKDYFATRQRINLTTDTRTATEYGVVRTYANMQFDFSQNRESIAGGFAEVDYAFIQFAGFTFGKAVSQFDPQWALSKPTISSGFLAGSNNTTGMPQLAYTASFGNGLSGTISLENASPYRNAGLYNTSNFIVGPGSSSYLNYIYGVSSATFLGNSYGGNHIPDIVGNLRLDQAWGTLHLGAAMHTITPGFYGANAATGHADDSYGFAINGAVEFKNLPTGAGDSLKLEATYARGAAKYAITGGTTDTQGGGRFAKFSGNTVGFGYVLDGVYGQGGQIQQSEAWSVVGFYEHYWNPAWRTSLFGSYSSISYGDGGNALLAAAFSQAGGRLGTANAANPTGTNAGYLQNTTGNFDFAIAQIGTRTAWTPVRNLTLSAEFTYSRMEQSLGGQYVGNVGGRPAGQTYQIQNQNLYNGSVQILRSF